MVPTSWPYVEWTETIGERGVEQFMVKEEVLLGEEVIGNMGRLTKVPIFSSRFSPHTLFIKGKKTKGILAENNNGEYIYYAIFENVHAGEELKIKVKVEGESTKKVLKRNGYRSNFAWDSRHVQCIVFPKGWKILSATPSGYVIENHKGAPSIKWKRDGEFAGNVQVKVLKD